MQGISNKSILTLTNHQLVSLSHPLQIADHKYFLVEVVENKSNCIIRTWEEISVIRSRFPEAANQAPYLAKGKLLQQNTGWPSGRNSAIQQVKKKFWDPENLDSSEFSSVSEDNNIFKNINKQNIKQIIKIPDNQPHKNKEPEKQGSVQQSQSESSSNSQVHAQIQQVKKSKTKKIKKIEKGAKPKRQSKTEDEMDRSHIEYYKILSAKPKNELQVQFTVLNILGEQQILDSQQFKKTHQLEAIHFFEKYLDIKK